MLLIPCPWCGPRDEIEFHYGGEAHVARPADPDALDDQAWADYLFMRSNPKGPFAERWVHSTGCRQWFNMLRDTVTYDIQAVYPMGVPRPAAPVPPAADTGTASTGAASTTPLSPSTAPEGATK
jgi:sarcosine oxidase, subunit delta